MNNLLKLASRFRESLILLLYIFLSVTLMLSSRSPVVEGLRSVAMVFLGGLESRFEVINNYFNLHQKNLRLHKTNTELALKNFQLQDALLENIRLRKLLQFKYEVNYELIPAKVVSYSPQSFVSGFLLSTEDLTRIKKNSAVITADGLVGRIVKVAGDYAICQSCFDPNSRISALIQRNRVLGIISWDGGIGLRLENIPNTIPVQPGDVIFTSGFSQIFPPNLKIGVVYQAELNESELFQNIKVKPAADLNSVEEVFIVNMDTQNEQ